jgi:hypothetical protein
MKLRMTIMMRKHWLKICLEEGLRETCGASSYRFAYDKIKEAAFSLVPEDDLGQLQLRLGEYLGTFSDALEGIG